MNKYQKALNRIKTINLDIVLNELGYEKACDVSVYGIHDYPTLEMNEDIQILQDLVDEETPMKPNNFDKEYCMYNCPNCSKVNATFKFSYCPHCGQKLDWSEK